MKKARKLFNLLGWLMMVVCLGIIAIGIMFNMYIDMLIPLTVCGTIGVAFMLISIGIDIIECLLNKDED